MLISLAPLCLSFLINIDSIVSLLNFKRDLGNFLPLTPIREPVPADNNRIKQSSNSTISYKVFVVALWILF